MLTHSGAMDYCHPRMRLEEESANKYWGIFFLKCFDRFQTKGYRIRRAIRSVSYRQTWISSQVNCGCIQHRSWGSWSGVLVSIKLSLTWVYAYSRYASLPRMPVHGKGLSYWGLQQCYGFGICFHTPSTFSQVPTNNYERHLVSSLEEVNYFLC
jgi:hypothetical protein